MVVVILQFSQSTFDLSLLHTILGSTNSGVLARAVEWRDVSIRYAPDIRYHSRSTDEELLKTDET